MKKTARYVFGAVLMFSLIVATWRAIRFELTRLACGTEEKLRVEETSDLRFEVTYLSCDTLAKDEAISVYAETRASDRAWFFRDWRNQRTLLFRYDPGKDNSPLPTITRPSPSTLLISIPEVSSIFYQSQQWGNMSVKYDIGRVQYSSASK